MSNESHDSLMGEIKAARPTPCPSATDWVRSDRGRSVFRRVLAGVETRAATASAQTVVGRGPHVRAWSRRGSRIAIVATILVVAVLALSLSLVFAGREADRPTVAQNSSTALAAPDTAEPTGGVTKLSAVENVMRLVHVTTLWFAEPGGSPTTVELASLLDQAVDLGLITRSEISGGSAAEPLSQGQYAVLLWKAFGPYVSRTTAPTSPVPGAVDPDEKAAIQGLQSAGVIREADGEFVADRPLDGEQEQLLLQRMEDALRGRVSD
jgi:anti-sigma-K factor RskA